MSNLREDLKCIVAKIGTYRDIDNIISQFIDLNPLKDTELLKLLQSYLDRNIYNSLVQMKLNCENKLKYEQERVKIKVQPTMVDDCGNCNRNYCYNCPKGE